MSVAGRPRRQMSLARFFVVSNVYTVVACFGVLPFFTLWDLGVIGELLFAFLTALVVPLLWALTSFVMIRDRSARLAAVAALLFGSLAATLVFAARTFTPQSGPAAQRGRAAAATGLVGIALIGVALLALVFVAIVYQVINIGRSKARQGDDAPKHLPADRNARHVENGIGEP